MGLSQTDEIQAAVLGALLLEPEKLTGEIMRRVEPEDFLSSSFRNLFTAARQLFLENRPIDPVVLLARAGKEYEQTIREALILTPTAANWEAYVGLLKEQSALERLRSLAREAAGATTAVEARELLAGAELLILGRPERRVVSYEQGLHDFLDRQTNGEKPDYLKWGFRQLDEMLTVEAGDFIILGAESSVGKTAFAVQLAYLMALGGKRVGVFSLETKDTKLYDRLTANTANIELRQIKARNLTQVELAAVVSEGEAHSTAPLYIIPASGADTDEIRAISLAYRFDVIFVDYVQILEPAAGRRSERWEKVTNVSMELHGLAQSLGITVIALSQMTPPAAGKGGQRQQPASKNDLRESRQLIHDADVILLLSLTEPDKPYSARRLLIAKNKDGPLGDLYLEFDADHMRFTVAPPSKAEQYRRIIAAAIKAKKERRTMESTGAQVSLEEMTEAETGPLPF